MTLSEYAVKFTPYADENQDMAVEEVTEGNLHWFDGCEYRCALDCPHTSKTRNAMAHHLKCSHKKKPDEGVNFHVIKESFIPCQICSLDMFHTDGEIRRHLTRYHSMTLEDYAEMYVSNGVLQMSIPEPIDLIEGMMTPKNIPWYDRCAYRCKSCTSIFWTVKGMREHIKKCNGGRAEKETVR